MQYPETKKGDVVDDYFGTKVVDPYRWMESLDSPEVAAWVAAQNEVTEKYLSRLPLRPAVLRERRFQDWRDHEDPHSKDGYCFPIRGT